MKREWDFLSQTTSVCGHLAEHVLEEHDGAFGALVASFTEAGRRFVGVAVDREGDLIRWVEAAVSELEWDSLLRGLTSLRDVLSKESVWVIDRNASLEVQRAWAVSFSQLTDDHLPDKDSLLEPEDHEHLLGTMR